MNECDREGLDTVRTTMVCVGGQAGDIKEANPTRPGETFLVARTWRCDGPPHDVHIRDSRFCASAFRGVERDVWIVRWGAPSKKRSQVSGRWVPSESPLWHW